RMSDIREIARQLQEDILDKIVLIYAFNAIGKTRLSVEYKNITKEAAGGKHAGVYYNAYSEDLFVWDNDEENDNANIKLKIIPSSLNEFHSFLLESPDLVTEKLALCNPKYSFRLNPNDDQEKGIESITFSLEENGE